FQNAGFKVKTRHVKDLKNKKKWKREYGTLFITGIKPEK
ncbi:MAG: methyltransferase type 11, partial [Nitrosopumilus sp.]